MRPIISTVNSYNYKMAKYIAKILQNYLRKISPDYIDSFRFSQTINETSND